YIRFSFAFSASSSRSRFTSDTEAPPYFPHHLKNVALLTPYLRSRSATGTPLSASFRIPTIWVSLNFDFRMTTPDAEQSTLDCSLTGEAYGRKTPDVLRNVLGRSRVLQQLFERE